MANAKAASSVAPENAAEEAEPRSYDPRKWVKVYDTVSGNKLPNPVPEIFLDGRFPRLKETPSSKKEGK